MFPPASFLAAVLDSSSAGRWELLADGIVAVDAYLTQITSDPAPFGKVDRGGISSGAIGSHARNAASLF